MFIPDCPRNLAKLLLGHTGCNKRRHSQTRIPRAVLKRKNTKPIRKYQSEGLGTQNGYPLRLFLLRKPTRLTGASTATGTHSCEEIIRNHKNIKKSSLTQFFSSKIWSRWSEWHGRFLCLGIRTGERTEHATQGMSCVNLTWALW